MLANIINFHQQPKNIISKEWHFVAWALCVCRMYQKSAKKLGTFYFLVPFWASYLGWDEQRLSFALKLRTFWASFQWHVGCVILCRSFDQLTHIWHIQLCWIRILWKGQRMKMQALIDLISDYWFYILHVPEQGTIG